MRRQRQYMPVLCWFAGLTAMWVWHAPTLCNAATQFQSVRRIQIVSLLVLGAMFWWPILGRRVERRLTPLIGVIYLASACLGCSLLGIILTFSPVQVCTIYMHPTDRLGILPLIRDNWGFNPAKDQQLGGLLMWVPACGIYFGAILAKLHQWYHSADVITTVAAVGDRGPSVSTSLPPSPRAATTEKA